MFLLDFYFQFDLLAVIGISKGAIHASQVTAKQLGADDNMRLLEKEEVGQVTGLSPSMCYRMRREGKFPQLIELSPHIKRNTVGQIRRWLSERADAAGG